MRTTIHQRWLLLCFTLIVALSWPLAASAQENDGGPTVPPSPQVAAPLYETRCANCHGPTGQGDGPQALQAGLEIPDLTDPRLVRETTPARWFDIVSNGVSGKAMPPFGTASSNPIREIDRWNLVFYLYTLGTPSTQVAMGEALYEMNCTTCHGTDGTGSDDVPGFTDLDAMADRSQAELFAAIADTTLKGHDPGLGEAEIWALADYVRTFSYNYAAPAEVETTAVTSPFSGGEGVVGGQVVNGTSGATPPAGLVVTLRAFDVNAEFVDSITTTVAADGTFRFDGIDATAAVQLEPLTVYKDIPYFGNLDAAITLSPEQPEANVDLFVYETTEDGSAIRIARLHLVFDLAPGQLQVAELYILSNDSDRTFVGTLEEGTLRLTVPANALSFQPGGDPNRYLTLADGIADTAPIPPGQSTAESVLVYDLAYDGELELVRPLPYDTSNVNIFVPADAGIEVSGERIQAGASFQAQSTVLQTYVAEDLAAGDNLTLRLSGEIQTSGAITSPSPHRSSGPNETQSIAIGVVAIIGAAILSYLYWQGHLSSKLRPAFQDRQADLLQAIADLDDDFETGRVKKTSYLARRAELKEELLELMQAHD
jgi:mono/diheme cytochrome c family protein